MRAIKDARLAVVVMLIEGVNFAKLMAECQTEGGAKSYFSLLASGMSIASALFDVAAVGAKNLPGVASGSLPALGAESWTYQALKGWGGVLSGGASLIGAWLDLKDAGKATDQGYVLLRNLIWLKSLAGFSTSALAFAVSYTYATGAIGRLTGTAVVTVTAEGVLTAVGGRAIAVVDLRIIGMVASGWFTVGISGMQIIIWIVTPDALEKWIDHSAFGTKRATGAHKNAKEQEGRLKDALIEIGLAQ